MALIPQASVHVTDSGFAREPGHVLGRMRQRIPVHQDALCFDVPPNPLPELSPLRVELETAVAR